MKIRDNHQIVIDRFVASCRADERVVAAFLGGSYARGAADEYSDLDLYLITTDRAVSIITGDILPHGKRNYATVRVRYCSDLSGVGDGVGTETRRHLP
ncbi:MAG TPA: nucleotidyltransferase domain-containing protein [Anaerolineae bacterium]